MKTILQVEDDPNDVFLVCHSLRKSGITAEIQVVTDGQQAINYLQGAGKYADRIKYPWPAFVLLDLKLPRVMGMEVLKWIRRESKVPLVVIIMSASNDDTDIATAYALGANAFLTKPAQSNKLELMLKAASDFWLTYNTPPQELAPESPMEGVVSLTSFASRSQFLSPQRFL